MSERPFVIVCQTIAANYPKLRERLSIIPIRAILYVVSESLSVACSVRSNGFHHAVEQRSRAAPCLGRSFSSTIIPENSYLSTRSAYRTFDTYAISREKEKAVLERFHRRPWLCSYSRRRFFSTLWNCLAEKRFVIEVRLEILAR